MTDDELNKDRPETLKFLHDLDVSTPFLVLGDDYKEWLRAVLNYKPVYDCTSLNDRVIPTNSSGNTTLGNVGNTGNNPNDHNNGVHINGDTTGVNMGCDDTGDLLILPELEVPFDESSGFTRLGNTIDWWNCKYNTIDMPDITEIRVYNTNFPVEPYTRGYVEESRNVAFNAIEHYLQENNFVYFRGYMGDMPNSNIIIFYVYKHISENTIAEIATLYNQSFCERFRDLYDNGGVFEGGFVDIELDTSISNKHYFEPIKKMLHNFHFGDITTKDIYLYNKISFAVGKLDYAYGEPAKFYFENVWGK